MPGAPRLKGLCAEVSKRETHRALATLRAHRLLDPRLRAEAVGARVRIPVRPEARGLVQANEWALVEAALPENPKRAPARRLSDRLAGVLPEALLARLPSGWQVVGDVVLVKPEPALAPHAAAVYGTLADLLGARSVLAIEGAAGELREPSTRLLWGDPDTETVHREHGLTYHLDPARVLFSMGNHAERTRLVDAVTADEEVVDLFAGIGYFTLGLARAGARVTACEKNPVSAAYLRRNVAANALGDPIEVREGDSRAVAPEGTADRVLLGYFPGTAAFLPTALAALGPGGGLLHFHTTASEPDALERAWRELTRTWPGPDAPHLVEGRRVKSYAPGVTHVVLDLEVRR